MPESNNNFSTLLEAQLFAAHKIFRRVTPIISGFLVLAGVLLVAFIIVFRFREKPYLGEDILTGALAVFLVAAGIALSALANGLSTRVFLEMAKRDRETVSEQLMKMRQALVETVADRLDTIEIPATLNLTKTQKTGHLSVTFKDTSRNPFEPNKNILGLTWKSDSPEVAKVDDHGVVTWQKAGETNVTVNFGNKSSGQCLVKCTYS